MKFFEKESKNKFVQASLHVELYVSVLADFNIFLIAFFVQLSTFQLESTNMIDQTFKFEQVDEVRVSNTLSCVSNFDHISNLL